MLVFVISVDIQLVRDKKEKRKTQDPISLSEIDLVRQELRFIFCVSVVSVVH